MNEIIQGDCLEVMRGMADNSVDLVFTSPPYNLGNAKKGSFYGGKSKGLSISYDKHNDDMPEKDYVKWQHQIITELKRLIKDDGAIFYNHKPRVEKGIYNDRKNLLPCGIRQEIIWDRCSGINFSGGFFLPTTEKIFIIAGPEWRPTKKYLKWGEVWRVPPETNTPHPAPFPMKLAKMVIQGGSDKGQVVLDPFTGSGTTIAAAELMGRKYIGIEISEEYCQLARKRVQEAKESMGLFVKGE